MMWQHSELRINVQLIKRVIQVYTVLNTLNKFFECK